MSDTCPVLSPAERKYMVIQQRAEETMMAAIMAAVEKAAETAASDLEIEDVEIPPPALGYFLATAHQKLFVRLCGGDPDTLLGGDLELARRILESEKGLSEHYWGAQPAGQSTES